MTATRDDIRGWLSEAKARGATHMLVVCDTFDYSDYPVFVMPGEDARKKARQNDGPNMTRLMEVYSMAKDVEEQLQEYRAFNY